MGPCTMPPLLLALLLLQLVCRATPVTRVALSREAHDELVDIVRHGDAPQLERSLQRMLCALQQQLGPGAQIDLESRTHDPFASVLETALEALNCDAVTIMTRYGVSLGRPRGTNPLVYTAFRGDRMLVMTQHLVRCGADSSWVSPSLKACLLMEVLNSEGLSDSLYGRTVEYLGSLLSVELLNREQAAIPDAEEPLGTSPLILACWTCNVPGIIGALVNSGAVVTPEAMEALLTHHPGSLANFWALIRSGHPYRLKTMFEAAHRSVITGSEQRSCATCGSLLSFSVLMNLRVGHFTALIHTLWALSESGLLLREHIGALARLLVEIQLNDADAHVRGSPAEASCKGIVDK